MRNDVVGALSLRPIVGRMSSVAREHYPEIRQYDLITQTEQYNLSNAAKAWIPQVTFSGQATYQSAAPTYPEAFSAMMQANGIHMTGVQKDQYKVAVDVSQHIWDGGKSKAERALAEAEELRRKTDVSIYELQSRMGNIYFGILLLDERKAQTEALIALLESNLARMRNAWMQDNTPIQVGVMAACPDGQGFNVKFENFKVKHLPDQRGLEWLKKNQE